MTSRITIKTPNFGALNVNRPSSKTVKATDFNFGRHHGMLGLFLETCATNLKSERVTKMRFGYCCILVLDHEHSQMPPGRLRTVCAEALAANGL